MSLLKTYALIAENNRKRKQVPLYRGLFPINKNGKTQKTEKTGRANLTSAKGASRTESAGK